MGRVRRYRLLQQVNDVFALGSLNDHVFWCWQVLDAHKYVLFSFGDTFNVQLVIEKFVLRIIQHDTFEVATLTLLLEPLLIEFLVLKQLMISSFSHALIRFLIRFSFLYGIECLCRYSFLRNAFRVPCTYYPFFYRSCLPILCLQLKLQLW